MFFITLLFSFFWLEPAKAQDSLRNAKDSRQRAIFIYNRINGVQASIIDQENELREIEDLVKSNDIRGAALRAINSSSGNFYNFKLVDFFSRKTNKDSSPRVSLNDMTLTMIGFVRDDLPFNTILSDDIIYNCKGVLPYYSPATNDHYKAIDLSRDNLKSCLARAAQSQLNGLPPEATAGIITTRAFAEAYFDAGTNRRIIKYLALHFLHKEMEQLSDTTRPDVRVRRDVSRSDAQMYTTKCKGCHAGMDGLIGAAAYYDFVENAQKFKILQYTPNRVVAKYNRNAQEYPFGYISSDDSWINLWVEGQNATLGWPKEGSESGKGLKALGKMFANTNAFATAMAEDAFYLICGQKPATERDFVIIQELNEIFKKDARYNMKELFAEAAERCL